MASMCISQTSYQRTQHHQLQLLLQQQHHLHQHQQQQQQQQHHHHNQQQQQQQLQHAGKVLSSSSLHNIQAGTRPNYVLPRKKYTYANMPYGEQLPSVARRNARERNRVKQVNNGFANLRQHLPQTVINTLSNGGRGASKKLSKVDTLRIAVEYIRGLQDLLDDARPAHSISGLDESSNDYSSSLGSPLDMQHQLPHSFHSEASASPTPSYTDSDISIGGANYLPALKLENGHQHQQFKFDEFDGFGSDEQPDDEELLDYISSWQEQQ